MPRTDEHFFAVHYTYHQYNGGDGFAGTRANVLRFATEAEAAAMALRIRDVAARARATTQPDLDEDVEASDTDLTNELVVTGMSGGFLLDAEVWETTVTRKKVSL